MTLIRSEISVMQAQDIFNEACEGFTPDFRICDLQMPHQINPDVFAMSLDVLSIGMIHSQVMYPRLKRTVSDVLARTVHNIEGEDIFVPAVDLEDARNTIGPIVYGTPAAFACGFAVYRT